MMRVFKFGGASIKDADSIRNVASIVRRYNSDQLTIIISASGKTTNAMEEVLTAYWKKQTSEMKACLDKVKKNHKQIMDDLFDTAQHAIYSEVHDIFVDLDWILEEEPQDEFDYLYDQIVSTGELLSTKIVSAYLNEIGLATTWLDVRDCIRTDNTYRDANINWQETEAAIQARVPALMAKGLVVTQGFLGGTTENFTTTLGREGSDFTAAIFSYCLDAQDMSIWKDVPGVLTADPRLFDDTELVEQLSYAEAIEMTYYGAQVIHPKTIRPLQNKKIPLYVKSFVNPEGVGTAIGAFDITEYPPMIVVKKNQALLRMVSKDFFFVDEAKFSKLFEALANRRIKVNMTQNTALAFSVCVNDVPNKINQLVADLEANYEVEKIENLKLVTIRHSSAKLFDQIVGERKIFLEEKIGSNIQLVMGKDEVL
ncbi:aspartate kinase [Aureispira anguillae]|uniref:Aspartokinase n=1 Tax=Aureispira anguillae TaxID=2864201 RepID=A0A915YF12_9BACT|nr:aspartate kinase [Aureispira anguillae]BDS11923.1 aspartate kinase [Aureispira anguillae]